jgi:hypothetical protein
MWYRWWSLVGVFLYRSLLFSGRGAGLESGLGLFGQTLKALLGQLDEGRVLFGGHMCLLGG